MHLDSRQLKIALLHGSAAAALGYLASSSAQSDNRNGAPVLEELVVTAQRRAERLEDVPMSITAITPEMAESRGIRNLQDLGQAVAGVQVNFQGSFTYPAVRGITSLTTGIGFDNNVGLYIDGFYQPDSIAVNADFANLESLQVLKGPQGALYGRNATGGAFLITTLRPSSELTGKLGVRYGNFNDRSVTGYISGPFSDRVRASLAIYGRESDGYYDLLDASGRKIGDAAPLESVAARTKLETDITESLTATLAYNFTNHDDPRGSMFTVEEFRATALPPKVGRLYERRTFATNRDTFTKAQVHEGTLTLAWKSAIGTLTSYTGYAHRPMKQQFDFDGSWLDVSFSDVAYDENTWQQSIDYNITAIDQLDLIVGVSYYNDRNDTLYTDGYANNVRTSRQTVRYASEASAAFADATYQATDKLALTLGARYTTEERKNRFKFISFTTGAIAEPAADPQKSYDDFSPRASIRYELQPGTNVYAQVSRGFRSGFQQTVGAITGTQSFAQTLDIRPEKITAYEIGFKTALSTLRFDAAAFFYDYKDLQIGITVPNPLSPAVPLNVISNADKAEIYGLEAQATWLATGNLEIDFSGAWLHARYKEFENAIATGLNAATRGNVSNQPQDWSGEEMARAPELTAALGVRYTIPGVLGGNLKASTNIKYTDSYVLNNPSLYGPLAGPALANEQRYRQSGYTLLNGALDWTDATEKYVVGVWGNNLADKDYRLSRNGSFFGDYGVWATPRAYGVRLEYNF